MQVDSRSRRLLVGALELGVLAALAYIPLLLTKPGMVSADTKQYLYLDPGSLLRQATSMWDPSTAAGTVTHQQIGYLLPQGPFYWILAQLHVPVWVAQRLWFGSLIFLGGAGTRFALRTLGLGGPGPVVAGVVYELSPYAMQYVERISAILMPWSGLGWMLGFTVLAIRKGGWRYPALFALVVALAGGTNATSLIYAGVAPLVWVLYVLFVTKENPVRQVVAAAGKIGALSFVVSLWWIAGLSIEGAYGIDVLKYTETVPAVAYTSTGSEVMRGLGYWYFYGSDRLGPWLSSSVEYTENIGLLAVSFTLPVLGFIGAAITRWTSRAYFALLAVIGLVLSVGTHPYDSPSALGGALKAFMTETTAGFALRSTDRATPLVVLGLAALLGAGLSAIYARFRLLSFAPAALATTLAIVNAAPLMTGLAVDPNFESGSHIPSYYLAAAKYLDAQGNSTRVLIEPGEDFADYDWGTTIDPVWPGVLTRPSIERQQVPDGSAQTADLLSAFDLTLQQGTYEPSTLAPVARLLSAGDVVLESDLAFWHYNTPTPRPTWALFNPPPAGIGKPITFGKAKPNEAPPSTSFLDEQALATSPKAPWPPPVAVFPVSDARPIYRAEPVSTPLVLDGSGQGVVAAAGAGLLANNPTIFYAGSFHDDPALLKEMVPAGADLVLTDTDRKVLRRWASVKDNVGETLPTVSVPQTPDPTAQPLEIFQHVTNAMQTIATYTDARYVASSTYGNPVTFTSENRPYMAFDGNPDTAWTTAAFSAAGGTWIEVDLDHSVTANYLDLVQPYTQNPNRWITRVKITFDGGHTIYRSLGTSSRQASGQIIAFPTSTFTNLRVTVVGTTWKASNLAGASGVGFAEIGIPGVNIFETMQLPSDMLSALGTSSLSHRLTIVLTRDRVSPDPPRSDPELFMSRSIELPTARTFSIGGTARISALIPDNQIDDILGGPNVFGGAVLGSNERLPGDLNARAVFAFDGNSGTFWGPGFEARAQVGAWLQANLTHSITFNHLDLQVLADREHSVPTQIRITSNDGQNVLLDIPPIKDQDKQGAVASVRLNFKAITGSVLRFTVERVRQVATENWYSESPIVLPFAIAKIGVPGLHFTPENPKSQIPAVCQDDLMTVDGKPVWIKVTGSVATAESLGGLTISGCGPDANGLHLGPGQHQLVTAWGATTGLDIDRLVLDSAPGGVALPFLANGNAEPVPGTLAGSGVAASATPTVTVLNTSSTSAQLRVSGATKPFWLVLGESFNQGWYANISGGASLGQSTLIDAYANGWYVKPGARSFVVDLVWRPQREVNIALVTSAVGIALCLPVGLLPMRLRKRPRRSRTDKGRRQHVAHAHKNTSSLTGTNPYPKATLQAPWSATGKRVRIGASVVAAVVASGWSLAVLAGRWAIPVAAVVAVVMVLGARWRGFRAFFALGAIGFSAAAGLITVIGQHTHHYPPGDAWPPSFETASIAAFVAFVALTADAILEISRNRREVSDPEETQPASGPDLEV